MLNECGRVDFKGIGGSMECGSRDESDDQWSLQGKLKASAGSARNTNQRNSVRIGR